MTFELFTRVQRSSLACVQGETVDKIITKKFYTFFSVSLELTYQKGSRDGVVGVAQRGNPMVCTEVMGSITMAPSSLLRQPSADDGEGMRERLTAICTLDGGLLP